MTFMATAGHTRNPSFPSGRGETGFPGERPWTRVFMSVRKTHSIEGILHSGGRPLLKHLDIELTERCNNRCIHCYNRIDDPSAAVKELSTEAIRDILGQACALGCISVRFTGGEPMLRGDFLDIYRHARSLGLQVDITTNGTLITTRMARTFAKIPPLGRIEVTLYGATGKSCEAVTRVTGSFERAVAGVKNLKDFGVPFEIRGVAVSETMNERAAFEEMAASLGPETLPPACTVLLDLRARRDSVEKNRIIHALRIAPEDCVSQLAFHAGQYIEDARRLLGKCAPTPGSRIFSCGVGKGSACLDSYGELQACFLLRHPETVYSLLSPGNTLEEALRVKFHALALSEATGENYLKRCARCFLHELCNQCPARSWVEHGTLDTPVDYHCEVTHSQGRALGILAGREKAWEVEDPEERIKNMLSNAPSMNTW